MKFLKFAVAAVFAATFGNAYAFHSGGVAECEGCHSMHNSFEGETNVTGRTFAQGTGAFLLKANDQSGSCLNCHQTSSAASSYKVSTSGVNQYDATFPKQLTPGGDFSWLKKTMSYLQVRSGTTSTITTVPERNGHNIIATDFGYAADSTLTTAPGGTYPASALGCQACHDPHGRYRRLADNSYSTTGLPIFGSGSYNSSVNPIAGTSAVGAYRILGGKDYQPKSLSGSFKFTADPMDVVVADSYNRTEATAQTGIAYGKNTSEWCANCHSAMHQENYQSGTAGLRHPAGNGAKLTAAIIANYNSYVSSGVMTNNEPKAAFSTLAPFEIGTADRAVLKPYAVTSSAYNNQNMPAADANSNVSCLSCHRAHATAFESMLRTHYVNEFITVADSAGAAMYDTVNGRGTGYDTTQQTQAYYGRAASKFGPYARSYCNKCHAKD